MWLACSSTTQAADVPNHVEHTGHTVQLDHTGRVDSLDQLAAEARADLLDAEASLVDDLEAYRSPDLPVADDFEEQLLAVDGATVDAISRRTAS